MIILFSPSLQDTSDAKQEEIAGEKSFSQSTRNLFQKYGTIPAVLSLLHYLDVLFPLRDFELCQPSTPQSHMCTTSIKINNALIRSRPLSFQTAQHYGKQPVCPSGLCCPIALGQ